MTFPQPEILSWEQLQAAVIAYEDGTMPPEHVVPFFQAIVDSGDAWTLNGHYGRTALQLLNAGVIEPAWKRIGNS
jgi:hypothetical protein